MKSKAEATTMRDLRNAVKDGGSCGSSALPQSRACPCIWLLPRHPDEPGHLSVSNKHAVQTPTASLPSPLFHVRKTHHCCVLLCFILVRSRCPLLSHHAHQTLLCRYDPGRKGDAEVDREGRSDGDVNNTGR